MKKWINSLTKFQKAWIVGATISILALGLLSGDTPMNVAIGVSGILYVSVYTTGVKESFLLGVLYVVLYTVICLQNRVMLDALQNLVLIPIFCYCSISSSLLRIIHTSW